MSVDFSLLDDGDGRLGVNTNQTVVKVRRNTATQTKIIYTLTAESIIGVGDTVASLSANESVYIEKGTYLYFGTKTIITTESKVIDLTSTDIAIQSATLEIAANETAQTYALITLPTTDIANNETVNKVDAKTHKLGEQGAMERVSREFVPVIPLIVANGDIGYFEHALPASINKTGYNGTVTAFIAVPTGNDLFEYCFGVSLVRIDDDSNPLDEIRRPSIELCFQSPWIKTTLFDAE